MARSSKTAKTVLLLQGTAAVGALGFFLLTIATQSRHWVADLGRQPDCDCADIAVEHSEPLGLSLTYTTKDHREGLFEIAHDGSGTILISLPENWTLREVRRALLSAVSQEAPQLGFIRWGIPAGATVSFRILDPPATATVHNPSGIPLKITLTRVDLAAQATRKDIYLVKDQPAKIW